MQKNHAELSDDQWQIICEALQRLRDRIAADPLTIAEDIDFKITDIV
ncbi:hypothetical protein AA23498_3442 [Acetobacter nitrogenifigens DSM 23921 = NBRC 105050]|nr:hypothetical protein AA23498_3442 [Acetobacter nitrogenifigens DSM 23921 = NBRC 105050]